MAETAALIRDSLPAEDRAHLGILIGDAGKAGHPLLRSCLWPAGCHQRAEHTLSARIRESPAETLIVIGFSSEARRGFQSCELASSLW